MSVNYFNTFIEVAEDCPVTRAEAPQPRGNKMTQALLEYNMLVQHPYEFTSEDILFETYAVRKGIPKARWPAERTRFLSQDQACLRASALGKRYGWGLHHNQDGKVALVALESAEYKRFANDLSLKHTKAMRSKRA